MKKGMPYKNLTKQISELKKQVKTLKAEASKGRRADEDKRRITHALKVLSDCNEAVVTARIETELLDRICRVIVEGCYRLAWVGYAVKDKKKTVRPMAHAGYEKGYLEKINITWADTRRGRGPTGRAIRTGKPQIARKIMTDPNFAPWRAEAKKRGYASSIAVPLIIGAETIGALNIYATEPDAFDREEVKLLTRLAKNLTYGIMTLRAEAEHKRIYEEMIQSEECYRILAESAQDFIFMIDRGGIVQYVNSYAAGLLGKLPEEIIGKPREKFFPKKISDHQERNLEEVFRTGKPMYVEDRTPFVGREVWLGTQLVPIKDRTGKVNAVLGVSRDITENKKIEEALSFERQQLLAVFNSTDEMIYVSDPNTHEILYANQSLKDAFGENIIGTVCYKTFQNLNAPCPFCTNGKIFGKGAMPEYIWEFHNNKIDRWFRCIDKAIKWPDGRTVRFEMAVDITERKRAEEALGRSEQEKAVLLDSMSELVVYHDTQMRVLWANKAAGDSVNSVPEQLVGRHCYEIWHQRGAPCEDCPVRKTLATGKPNEGGIVSPDGRVWFIRSSPVNDEKGKVIGAVETALEITEQKRAEDALRESEEMYRTLVKAFPDSVAIIDLNGTISYVSERTFELYGTENTAEVLGKGIIKYIATEHHEYAMSVFEKILKEELVRNIEFKIFGKDGVPFIGEISAALINDVHGNPKSILVTTRDITKQKEAERALKESNEKLKVLIQASPLAIVALDTEGKITIWNPAAERIFGWNELEVLGRTMPFVPEDRKEESKALRDRVLRGDAFTGVELIRRRKDGSTIYISLSTAPQYDAEGNISGIIGVVEDITERRKAEEAEIKRIEKIIRQQIALVELAKKEFTDLTTSLKRITEADARTLEVERVGVWVFNEDHSQITCIDQYLHDKNTHEKGAILSVNQYPNYFRALETSRTITANDVYADPRTSEFTEDYLKVHGITSMMDVPIRLHGKNVGIICHEHIGPMREWTIEEQEFAGSIADLISLAMESSERKRAEEMLRRAKDEVELYNDLMSHDLTNFNQTILGNLNILESKTVLDEKQKKYVEACIRQIAKSENLISKVRALSRMEKMEEEKFKPISLNKSIEEALKTVRGLYPQREIEVEFKPTAVRKAMCTDLIGSVFMNLIENAVKHAPGDKVKIEISIEDAQTDGDDYWEISISDDGSGVPDEMKDRIFDRFSRIGTEKGMGLGLFLAKAIVDKFNGNIFIEDRVKGDHSKGSIFKVILPKG
ncbi:MAG: PAS domain S-box protein [bacterium]